MDCLLSYFGPGGSAYEDTRVVDMLDCEPINHPGLEKLLLHIKETWIKEVGPLEEVDDFFIYHAVCPFSTYTLTILSH